MRPRLSTSSSFGHDSSAAYHARSGRVDRVSSDNSATPDTIRCHHFIAHRTEITPIAPARRAGHERIRIAGEPNRLISHQPPAMPSSNFCCFRELSSSQIELCLVRAATSAAILSIMLRKVRTIERAAIACPFSTCERGRTRDRASSRLGTYTSMANNRSSKQMLMSPQVNDSLCFQREDYALIPRPQNRSPEDPSVDVGGRGADVSAFDSALRSSFSR
jgi:hypothetical protein